MFYAGIDYSMSCPALLISENPNSFLESKVYFLTDMKKYQKTFGNITGIALSQFDSNEKRFDNISNTFLEILSTYKIHSIGIESYSYGSTGTVFQIAENTGLLKHKLYKNNYNFSLYAPTAIKKYAFGNGNAKKDDMYNVFMEKQNKLDLRSIIGYDKKSVDSPLGDIIDAFWICQYHFNQINESNSNVIKN